MITVKILVTLYKTLIVKFLAYSLPLLHQRKLLSLALPMILSNITVPLLGLVDTAVIGHLSHAYYLGGSTVGAMIITFIIWLCGFLRMSTTGLTAQAFGAKDNVANLYVLSRGLLVALLLALLFIAFKHIYIDFSLWLAGGSEQVQFYAKTYANIRIWGLPAALANLVLLGWLLGNHRAKQVMWLLIITNVLNLLLDLVFVLLLDMNVAGVAYATLIAEYTTLFLGLAVIFKGNTPWWQLFKDRLINNWLTLFALPEMKSYFALNRDILIRTLCLEFCFVFMTFQGARLGDDIVAANAILMNFLLLISFGLDGIANAAEVMVGEAKGAKNKHKLKQVVITALVATGIFAVLYAALFALLGPWFIEQITSIDSVIIIAKEYVVWLYVMPILACWCYLFDGIYVGLMQAKVMRNSMMLSTFLGFFPLWYIFQALGNHALWLAFSIFMVLRGVTLAWHYYQKVAKANELIM